MTEPIIFYVACNHLGQFSCGNYWVDSIEDARIMRKRGPVSSAITRYTKANPGAPVPKLLMWEVQINDARLLDVSEVTHNRIAGIKRRTLKRETTYNQSRLQSLREQEARLKSEMAALEGRK